MSDESSRDGSHDKVGDERRYYSIFHSAAVSLWEVDAWAVREWIRSCSHSDKIHFRTALELEGSDAMRLLRDVRVLDANAATLHLFGATQPTELTLRPPDGGENRLRAAWLDLLADIRDEKSVFERELRFSSLDGRALDVLVSLRIPTVAADWRHVVVSMLDRTLRRRLERQLADARRMEAVGRLTAGVAHDLNNILTVMRSHADLLEPTCSAVGAGEDLMGISDAIDRAAALTSQLLAVCRRQPQRLEVLDLNRVIESIAPLLERLVGDTVLIRLELDSQIGLVRADRSQIDQLLLNLATNAKDAMPHGGELSITTQRIGRGSMVASYDAPVEASTDYVGIRVTDTGTGIDEQTREHMFEPFFTTRSEGSGTGLGLATVYGVVKQTGGQIDVHSELGQGTTFEISLPVTTDVVQHEHSSHRRRNERHGSDQPVVLLVDDDAAVRRSVRRVLERHGYLVFDTDCPDDAVAIATKDPARIALLLTDVVMPRANGRELAQTLRTICPDLRVMFMSGFSEDALPEYGDLAEGTAFIGKPFAAQALVKVVRELLDGSG